MLHPESFPEMLKAYRKTMGWTQEELARQWSYSTEAISAWERGKRNPSTSQIPRIARLLDMEPEELLQSVNAIRDRSDAYTNQEIATDEMRHEWLKAMETWGEIQNIYQSRTEFSRDFSYPRMFEDAHDILAVGISLNAIAMNYSREKIIQLITEKKSTISLCFLDPKSVYFAEREHEENIAQGMITELTRLNISTMEITRNHISRIDPNCTEQLKILTYDLPARFNIYIVDDAVMTMQCYAYGRGEDTPTFVLRRQSDHGLFAYYASIAKHILEQAKPISV